MNEPERKNRLREVREEVLDAISTLVAANAGSPVERSEVLRNAAEAVALLETSAAARMTAAQQAADARNR